MLAGARLVAYSTHAVHLQVHAYFCKLHALAVVPWHFALCEQRRRMFARALRGSGLRVFVGPPSPPGISCLSVSVLIILSLHVILPSFFY